MIARGPFGTSAFAAGALSAADSGSALEHRNAPVTTIASITVSIVRRCIGFLPCVHSVFDCRLWAVQSVTTQSFPQPVEPPFARLLSYCTHDRTLPLDRRFPPPPRTTFDDPGRILSP